MSKSSAIQAHTDKYSLLGALDPDTDEIKPVNLGDGTVLGMATQLYVWDTDTTSWVKMQQPSIEAGDLYLAVDEVENLLQAAPVTRSNKSFALTYTGDNLTQIDMTVQGTVYRRTLTYSGSTLTNVSAWVEQ